MSTDHNRTPVEKSPVEGAPQEHRESICLCLRNRGWGENLIEGDSHEFTRPLSMLDHTFGALRSGGQLVVLDRGLRRSTMRAVKSRCSNTKSPLRATRRSVG